MTVTREAIEDTILEAAGWYGDGYDAASAQIGHDLADVINLGLAVLECESTYHPELGKAVVVINGGWCKNALGLLKSIFARAGVERPAT